jgi:hypothetical protein
MQAAVAAVFVAILLGACLPPTGRQFHATLGIAADDPLPVTLGDQTGLVEGIEPAWLDNPPPISSLTLAGGRSPHEFVVLWPGGLCDNEAILSLTSTTSGYAMHLEVRRKFGSCASVGLVRSLRIELSKPTDPKTVTLSGDG